MIVEKLEQTIEQGASNLRQNNDVVSIQLHGVKLVDSEKEETIDATLKTFNSASRCAFKRFKSIGLRWMLKSHKEPYKRNPFPRFLDVPFVDGKPRCFECPPGMSDKMWLDMRREAYLRKRNRGIENANKFWQRDKDLGSPIAGAIESVREWARENQYSLDSILAHNATMVGFKNYMSFERQTTKWKTKKDSPAFGLIEERSRKKITKAEYDLSKNASLTVVGKARVGNPKFKFNLDGHKMSFILDRRRIDFDFSSHRASKRGWEKIEDVIGFMNDGKLPVTVTLTKTENGKYNVTLSYSPSELQKLRKEQGTTDNGIRCSLYFTEDRLCHNVVDTRTGKTLVSKIYNMDKVTGRKRAGKYVDHLLWVEKDYKKLSRLRKTQGNRTLVATSQLLNKIFRINKAHGVSRVVVESPSSRTKRNFNNSYIGFNKGQIGIEPCPTCFMSAKRLVALVKNQCSKNGMEFKKVNGSFVQMRAIMASTTMEDAIRNAARSLVDIDNGLKPDLTELRKWVSDPSMLDWVKHLLHNKRNRQARLEVRKAFQSRVVEKATRLLDKRSGCMPIN